MADAVITEMSNGNVRVEFQGAVFFVSGQPGNIGVRPAEEVSDELFHQLIDAIDVVFFECY